jgi:hypothetical protein
MVFPSRPVWVAFVLVGCSDPVIALDDVGDDTVEDDGAEDDTGVSEAADLMPQACGVHWAADFGATPMGCDIRIGFQQVIKEGERWDGGQAPPEDGTCMLWDGKHPSPPEDLEPGETVFLDLGDDLWLSSADREMSLAYDPGGSPSGSRCGDHVVSPCDATNYPFGDTMDLGWSGGEGEYMLEATTLSDGVAFPSEIVLVLPDGADVSELEHDPSTDLLLAWYLSEDVPWLDVSGSYGESRFGEDIYIHRMGPGMDLREQLWCRPVHGDWGFEISSDWLEAMGSLATDESFVLDVRFNWEYWPDGVVVPGSDVPMRIIGQHVVMGELELDD